MGVFLLLIVFVLCILVLLAMCLYLFRRSLFNRILLWIADWIDPPGNSPPIDALPPLPSRAVDDKGPAIYYAHLPESKYVVRTPTPSKYPQSKDFIPFGQTSSTRRQKEKQQFPIHKPV